MPQISFSLGTFWDDLAFFKNVLHESYLNANASNQVITNFAFSPLLALMFFNDRFNELSSRDVFENIPKNTKSATSLTCIYLVDVTKRKALQVIYLHLQRPQWPWTHTCTRRCWDNYTSATSYRRWLPKCAWCPHACEGFQSRARLNSRAWPCMGCRCVWGVPSHFAFGKMSTAKTKQFVTAISGHI
jgi:hypothetical protein